MLKRKGLNRRSFLFKLLTFMFDCEQTKKDMLIFFSNMLNMIIWQTFYSDLTVDFKNIIFT